MGMKNKISLENDEGRFFIHTFIYIKNTPTRVFSQMYREAIRFQYFTHKPMVASGVARVGPRVPGHPQLTSRHPQHSSLNT